MKILTRKIFREIRRNKFRSVVIILTVVITISLGIGLLNIKDSYDATIAAHHENLNNADLRVRLNEYIPEENLSSWIEHQDLKNADIENLEGRIFLYGSVTYEEEEFKAYIIGVNLSKNNINSLELTVGEQPSSSKDVLIEKHFRSAFLGGVNTELLNKNITINSGLSSENFTISGITIDSDYFYPVDEQTNYASFSGDLAIVYVPLQYLQNFLGVEGINEILVQTATRTHETNEIADQAITAIVGSEKIRKVIYWDEAPDLTFFYIDNPHDKVGIVFGIFGLIAGSTAIYNSLSKLVIAQRTHIGLYGALGAKKRDVFFHYLGFGVILGIIGLIIGWIGAGFLSLAAVNIRGDYHGFTVVKVGFDPLIWIGGSLIAMAVISFFSFLATLPILRLTPREAMVAPYSKSQLGEEPILEKILKRGGILRKLTTSIPLRTVFMNKKRSLATIVAVATSMIILIAATSFTYDVILAMDNNYTYYEKFDGNVLLQAPTPEHLIKANLQDIEEVGTVEGYIGTQVFLSDFNGGSIRVPLYAFHENSTLRDYHIIRGSKDLQKSDLGKDSILIGSNLAEDNNIKVGDKITITFDQNNSFELEIAGITGELIDNALLWTIEGIKQKTPDIQNIGLSENVTSFVFSYSSDLTDLQKVTLKTEITEIFNPYLYSETKETLNMMETMLEMIMGLLIFVGLLGLGALVLFTFSSMSLTMMDREMEFLALRAMGSKRRSILKVIFLENLLYGLSGLIIGIFLSLSLLRPSYDYLIADMYVPVVVPIELWLIVIGSIFLCVFLSTSLLAWRTWRTSLPDMLHNRMIS
ncbi:MAG: ABC transporter permease [Candidatus Hodarchaeales archaeon]